MEECCGWRVSQTSMTLHEIAGAAWVVGSNSYSPGPLPTLVLRRLGSAVAWIVDTRRVNASSYVYCPRNARNVPASRLRLQHRLGRSAGPEAPACPQHSVVGNNSQLVRRDTPMRPDLADTVGVGRIPLCCRAPACRGEHATAQMSPTSMHLTAVSNRSLNAPVRRSRPRTPHSCSLPGSSAMCRPPQHPKVH